ncbi:hypothetical protein PC116_g7551 [Phytophthora cactorum]|uniref:Peptidase M14 domain-containing protein n=1 Tax=Phytophthora cactorum TaxID=29920 RepID=A0A329SMM9_9STRA|nr:hypothetical protein PC112_g5388 [Phytophthora cactorum]KAG2839527.1 hypothetical protein PC111_g3842 [Phytophthora cactorum]KAG2863922.1 hypothetical protein PC113_g5044 [Phytophthora cactorum]KAG2921779.1 hypothetical protein PC114_g5553 [Phytophthora cactorum]KAG2937274.1 hypothetical protein PC115_g4319 [Phytophthora cactorum]
MSSVNPRANRFRKVASQSILVPPPLPLINLPEEPRLVRTGVPDERPMYLPVRRLLPNAVAIAALKSSKSVDFNALQPPKPEPILQESRTLLDVEAEAYEEHDVLSRLHVYEYNQPKVFRDCNAPDDTLVFDSLFEGGNLLRAERIFRKIPSTAGSQQEYDLLIHPDVKNGAYRQWFYFEIRNGKPGITYRFALVNLAKSGALFGQGLQPVVYSEQDAAQGLGWRHRGSHVRYDVAVSPMAPPGANALTFQYEFEHENDCVYFACIQPYTYTDLMDYLELLERDPQRSLTCRRTELCQSLAGNACDLLSITSTGKDGLPPDERRIIVVSARVHPGEPNSSWMMQGMLDYLTGSSSGATVLRRNFVFKVAPMLNPDGVINGNTRVSLAGWDLNRKWSSPIEQLFPTIYHLKQQLAHFQSRGRVAVYCDLHGHSINRNIFTYGCYTAKKKTDGSKSSGDTTSSAFKSDPRVFPMIVARHARHFSFADCDFSVHKSKMTTARVVVNQELGVTNSYTLEASFCGPDFGARKGTQFSTWDLEEMGRSWCQSLIVYYGLTSQVKALDLERKKQAKLNQSIPGEPSPTGRQSAQTQANEALLRLDAEDEESRLASDLLLDCEAAISALFAASGVDVNDRDDDNEMDSDLSGAEEEPIPPSPEQQITPQVESEPKKPQDEVEATEDSVGSASAPEEVSTTMKSSDDPTSKKPEKHKQSRGIKLKAVVGQAMKKADKAKKKKKRKGKPELKRTYSTTTPPMRPKPEDAPRMSPELAELLTPDVDTNPKPLTKRTTSAARKSMSARPKRSSETPKSVSSAILQATKNVDLRPSSRLGSIPTYPNTPMLVLPSVVDSSRVITRALRTAPAHDQDFSGVIEEKTQSRIRSELPALQLSGRDEDQRRQSLRRKSRRQENDMKSDDSDALPIPESYGSSKLLNLVT